MAKSICALVGMECPKTGDPTARIYCPHWKVGIPEHTKDGSGQVVALELYTGCQIPKLIPYLQSITAEADHAHAAANQARDASIEVRGQLEGVEASLRGAVLTPLLESLVGPRPRQLTITSDTFQVPPYAEISEGTLEE